MRKLPDSIRLSELSIPGTHISVAFLGGDIWQTQSMPLSTQLDAGVRVLDIRLGHVSNHFGLYSGSYYQGPFFGFSVMRPVNTFLTQHPNETVLMRVKEEISDVTPKNNTRTFAETFDEEISAYNSKVWKATSNNPTLGEVRGKIVILDDFSNGAHGIPWSSANIQDNDVLTTNYDLGYKWMDVKAQLNAADRGSSSTLYVNFLNGTTGSLPYFVASGHSSPETGAPRLLTGLTEGVIDTCSNFRHCIDEFPRINCFLGTCSVAFEGTNILTMDYINNGSVTQRAGIIMADFPGAGLIESIINLNRRPATIISSNTGIFTVGAPGSFTVTAAGVPAPVLTETGELPVGLSFTDNHNGTATLAGTPTAAGSTTVTVRASNGVGPDATQTLTIDVAKASTLTSVTPSPAAPLFGHPVTLTATVSPAPPSSGTPTGTVTFSDGATPLATMALTGGSATFTTAKFQGGLHSISVSYEGDANYLPSQTSQPTALTVGFSQPCITTLRLLPLNVASGQALCVGGGGSVVGPVTVQPGGALSVTGGRITGALIANDALAVTVCDSTLTGPVSVRGSTGYVLIGDDADDAPGCAGNRINGAVTLSSNTGGLEASANTITGTVSVTNNSGSGLLPEDAAPEVEANRIVGALACSGNTPRLVAAGNTVTGARSGQCA